MKSIIFENIDFSYKKQEPLFRGLNLQLGAPDKNGYVTAIMGASGSGKTTLLKLMLGVLKPQKGQVGFAPDGAVFSYVPQEPVLFEHLSPMDNAKYFYHTSKLKKHFNNVQFERLVDLLEIGTVLEKRKHVSEMSGGQQQRLSLLRALSIQPDILLLDEPCTGLDADVKFAFLTKLHELVTELDLFAVYVTHHIDEAKFMGNEIAFLVQDSLTGRVEGISQQPVDKFLSTPPTLDALRLIAFPKINIAGIQKDGGLAKLSATPNSYISLTDNNKIITMDQRDIPFSKIFSTGAYACYRHNESQTTLTISANSDLADVIYVNINGSFAEYGRNGIYQQTINLNISEIR